MSDSDFFDLPIRLHAVNGVHRRVGGDAAVALARPSPDQRHLASPVAALTRHRTCVAADLRGYGDSDKPPAAPATPRIPSASWPRTWRR